MQLNHAGDGFACTFEFRWLRIRVKARSEHRRNRIKKETLAAIVTHSCPAGELRLCGRWKCDLAPIYIVL